MKKLFVILLILTGCDSAIEPAKLPEVGTVPVLDIYLDTEAYASMLANRWSDQQVRGDIYIGTTKYFGGIEPQGAGSRYHARWSYKLELLEGKRINGLVESNLSGQTFDRSMIRTRLASEVFHRAGFPLFRSFPVFVRINTENKGLYLQNERIREEFFHARGIPVHELMQVKFAARFTFAGGLDLSKHFEKQIPEDENFGNLADFIRALDAIPAERFFPELEKYLDIHDYIRYHAVTSILNHVDGMANNFFLYKQTPTAPYRILPWDFDKVLPSGAKMDMAGGNDIINRLFENDSCQALYKTEVRHIIENIFTEEILFPIIDDFASTIAKPHDMDPYLGRRGISLESEVGALKTLLIERRKFYLDNIDSL